MSKVDTINKATLWLIWRARLQLPGQPALDLGHFVTVDDAARAYDAEVRRRGWAHVRPLNFPQPQELAAYAVQRCDERGLLLSLAPNPPAGTEGSAAAAQGAPGQRLRKLSAQKPSKSGFFGVTKAGDKCYKATPWRAEIKVSGGNKKYAVGHFATRVEAARAYDAEVRRRGWTLIKRLNFLDPAGDAALPPSSAAAGAAGPE